MFPLFKVTLLLIFFSLLSKPVSFTKSKRLSLFAKFTRANLTAKLSAVNLLSH